METFFFNKNKYVIDDSSSFLYGTGVTVTADMVLLKGPIHQSSRKYIQQETSTLVRGRPHCRMLSTGQHHEITRWIWLHTGCKAGLGTPTLLDWHLPIKSFRYLHNSSQNLSHCLHQGWWLDRGVLRQGNVFRKLFTAPCQSLLPAVICLH